jgi:hypothetical protein
LTDPYQVQLSFAKKHGLSGMLKNPLEVVSGLPQLANWIMDVVLDFSHYKEAPYVVLFNNLNVILTYAISSKHAGPLRFGVGPRGFGGTRLQIIRQGGQQSVYPSIFNISSGESAMLCLFGELIRQADNNKNNIAFGEISGIVLVDEVDKHLHIKLQKEILPVLFNLFPNVQFILSSHSPFLSMGLAEVAAKRTKIIDLETFGISKDPTTNELYNEVYRMMIGENDRFKELYKDLETKVKSGTKPLVITEGKTDVQHLRIAKKRLAIQDCDVEFFDIQEEWGDSKLKLLLQQLSKIPQPRKIIGIFDRDVPNIVTKVEKDGKGYKDYGNNVFAFCIPIPSGREQYTNISIEFFYKDADIKKENNGQRLYFSNEVVITQSATNKSEKSLERRDHPCLDEENAKKIHDENIGSLGWAHSKARFAELVETNPDFSKDFDFSGFNLIFDRLRKVLKEQV